MIVLWIFLGILSTLAGLLLLLALLLSVPVHGTLYYKEKPALTLRYLWIRIPVLPLPEKPKKEPTKKKKKPEPEQKEKKPGGAAALLDQLRSYCKAEGFGGLMQLAKDLLARSGSTVWRVLRHLRIRSFDLYAVAAGADAASAAILYGRASALLYAAAGLLFSRVPARNNRITVDLDFNASAPWAELTAELSVRPIFLAVHGLRYLIGLLPIYQQFQSAVKRGRAMRRKAAANGSIKEKTNGKDAKAA